MKFIVREVHCGTGHLAKAVAEFASVPFESRSGREIAIRALTASPDVPMLIAYEELSDRPVGACSYRITGNGITGSSIQRINTGVTMQKVGIGRALVEKICELYPGVSMWCKSLPQANAFCESLGMKNTGVVIEDMPVYAGLILPKHKGM